jgi:ABC-2 type transport system permease protein
MQNFSQAAYELMMFTVIPAAFLTGVPVHLVDHFRWATLAAMLGVAVGSVLLAGVVFRAGLRRYRSGALWTRA